MKKWIGFNLMLMLKPAFLEVCTLIHRATASMQQRTSLK